MTLKYYAVRRDMFEIDPSSNLKSYRSFSDLKKLLKRPFLIMLGLVVIAFIALASVAIFTPSPIEFLLMTLIITALLIIQIPREKYIYNEQARENELSEKKQDYEKYVKEILKIMQSNGIDSTEKVLKLKTECETALKVRDDKYTRLNSRIFDMVIGVPLGALIASIIYTDSNAVVTSIGTIILGGLAVLGVIKLFNLINYYSAEYYKDKYLLNAISEIEYSFL